MVQECIEDSELHMTAREGIISLLEKLGKDPMRLKQWRPLTLLNSDNKIYSKALAKRLQKTQQSLISLEQTGFVKNRQLSTNVIKIMEILNHCEEENIDSVLIGFDFLKAFDTVEWDSIWHAMTKFGFGPKYIEMVKVLFKNLKIYAYNNGKMSNFIMPTRGCQQGCCYSPIIFTYVVELLGLAIRQDENIVEIQIGDSHIKSGQFADDLWASLKATEQNIDAMIHLLSKFYAFSGLKINAEKSAILCMGPWKNSDAKFYTLKRLYWSPNSITILGFKIYPDIGTIHKENFDVVLKKVDEIITRWKGRKLTLMGKVMVINHLINSLMIHKLIALPTPTDQFFKEYKAKIMDFMWEGRPAKIRYEKIIQNYEKHRLKLIDIKVKEKALKIA